MKESENNKSTWALGISIVAILLCLLVFVLWAFDVYPRSVVSAESFISACVALLGVIVTMAVGWQIYNAIEIKEKVTEIDHLQQKLDGQEHRMEQMYYNSCRVIGYAMSTLADNQKDEVHAFRWIISSLKFSLLQDVPQDVDKMLFDMNSYVNAMPNSALTSKSALDEIYEHDRSIRNSSVYKIFASEYEKIFAEFVRKAKIDETAD